MTREVIASVQVLAPEPDSLLAMGASTANQMPRVQLNAITTRL